jgi:hypothetical protein
MGLLTNCKLTYFDLSGRGDPCRLALTHGGIEFTDNRVAFPDWGAIKSSMPFGQLPVSKLSLPTTQGRLATPMR